LNSLIHNSIPDTNTQRLHNLPIYGERVFDIGLEKLSLNSKNLVIVLNTLSGFIIQN